MPDVIRCQVGIILEKRPSDNPWIDHQWVAKGFTLDVVEQPDWTLLYETDSGVRAFLSAPVTLDLYSQETEAYLYNLASPLPSLFVVLREDDESEDEVPFAVHLLTASPYEAQDYLDSSEEHVDRIAMDEAMRTWVEHFVDKHHVEQNFKKRQRDKVSSEEHKFGQEPVFELRKRKTGPGGLH